MRTMTPWAERWKARMNVVLLRDGDDFEIEFDFANLRRGNAATKVAASLWLMFEKKPRNLPWLFHCRRNVGQHHATGTHLTQFVQSGAPAHGKHWHTPHDHAIQRFDIEPVFMNFRTIYRNHIQALYWLPHGHRLAATDKTLTANLVEDRHSINRGILDCGSMISIRP